MTNYDVFISCKSEDYKYAEKIYNYLMEEGVNTFLSSQELRKMGESEYRKAISSALKGTYHMIVFASRAEYVTSTWVEYEWDMFVNAKLKGKKQGNIVTVLKEVATDDLPMDLWKYESFTYDDYKSNILKYVETQGSKERKEEILRQRQQEQLRLEELQKQEAKKKELKEKLELTAVKYKRDISALQVEANIINGILHELNISERICPICDQKLPLEETYCPECGWPISPLDGINELNYLGKDSEDVCKSYRSHYNEFIQLIKREKEYKNELEACNEAKAQLKATLRNLKAEKLKLEQKLQESTQEKSRLKKELDLSLDDQIQLEEEINKLKNDFKGGSADNSEVDRQNRSLSDINNKLRKEIRDCKEEISRLEREIRIQNADKSQLDKDLVVLRKELNETQGKNSELLRSYLKAQNKIGELEYRITQLLTDLDNYKKSAKEIHNSAKSQSTNNSSSNSKSNSSSSSEKTQSQNAGNKVDEYSVWLTSCPLKSINEVKQYNTSFTKEMWEQMANNKRKIFIVAYSSLTNAAQLKSKLELRGAKVEIWHGNVKLNV